MRLVMMGTGTFAEPAFEALLKSSHQVVGLVTQPDRPVGAERGSTRRTGKGMKPIALERGVPVYQPESINTPEGVAKLQEWQPDLLVVAAYGQILKPQVLAVTPHGGINIHASLLPKYRGAAPVAWAIYHGEKQTGVTIIQMTPQLDAGGMLVQAAIDILPYETAGVLEARLAPLGAKLALQAIEEIASGKAQPIQQDKSQATKAPKLKKDDGLIDWTRSAEQVCNQVRAMQPWPTAYTFLHRKGQAPLRIIVCRAEGFGSFTGSEEVPPTGMVGSWPLPRQRGDPPYMVVSVGSREWLEIFELQPAGKRRMSAQDFLRGHPLQEGDRFGSETP